MDAETEAAGLLVADLQAAAGFALTHTADPRHRAALAHRTRLHRTRFGRAHAGFRNGACACARRIDTSLHAPMTGTRAGRRRRKWALCASSSPRR
jgi:hypothetical protein